MTEAQLKLAGANRDMNHAILFLTSIQEVLATCTKGQFTEAEFAEVQSLFTAAKVAKQVLEQRK